MSDVRRYRDEDDAAWIPDVERYGLLRTLAHRTLALLLAVGLAFALAVAWEFVARVGAAVAGMTGG